MLTVDEIKTIAGRLQKIYLIFVCLGIPVAITYLFTGIYSQAENLQGFLNILLESLIFLGLRRKKHWVVVLGLIFPALWLLSGLAFILLPALDLKTLFQKFVAVALVLFYAYQINFFSKYEVKKFYGMKGFIIF
jgi:hypothetical protein